MAAQMSSSKMEESVVFEEKLQQKLCSFLDENFPEDLSNVKHCLERMERQRNALEKQLAISESSKDVAPLCVGKTVEEANSALENVDKIQCSLEELNTRVGEHNDNVDDIMEQLESLNNTVKKLENLSSYIKCLHRVEQLSNIIHQGLETGSLRKAISELLAMKNLLDNLQGTSCYHLNHFIVETLKHWNKIVVDKLAKEFNEVLGVLKWPFTSGSTAPSLASNLSVFQTLESLFLMLLQVSEIKAMETSDGKTAENISLPMDFLLQPLRKRFHYHFYGKKQTNNLEKPEWFYTQILNWLRDHEDFLDSTIQPIIDKSESSWSSAQAQFCEGLLQLVVDKMDKSIPLVLNDEALFSHFVDETLLFDQELRNTYDLSQVNSNCLDVLVKQPCFAKWVALEKMYAMENIQSLLSSDKAWSPRYEDAADVDDLRVPECVETFASLLVERYKNLPGEENQISFVNVQLDLLYFFTASLDEIGSDNGPLTPCFLFIINSTNYLETILQDWSEQTFFLKLNYARMQLARKKRDEQKDIPADTINDELQLDNYDHQDGDFDESGTLFEGAIAQLKTLQSNMLTVLVKHVGNEFKMKSELYRNESWHSLPSHKDLAITSLSSSLCDMIIYLRDILRKLKQEMADCLFTSLWKQLATDLSEFLFNEVVLKSHFNEGGAAQLKFDVHKNLFVLFGQFTSKPENYFRKLKEAIILLNLMPGSAVLLKETLDENKRQANKETTQNALDELGVYMLSVNEVLNVLNSRINWTK
ncbi:RAD50-interacting protein 1-like [Dendronephthya gigantea]|uniref:RAD50-interacting protein 1-like n=1 Tax=Dendronephthya gigantea TaxID=151771 RepID=UPI00106A0B63|nr:RAD50-interacting protein 1-like [Dendronephthya gigantea]